MDINCPCGSVIKKTQLYRHLKSKKHLNYKPEEIKEEIKEESKEDTPIDDNKSQSSNDTDNDTDDDNQEVEELIIEAKDKKKIVNKEHLDRIREKAHEVLKAKKMARIQAKLDKENELLNKARLYDELLILQDLVK